MTEFQICLIVIGVVVIIGILIYNKWREVQGRRTIERAFPDHDDAVTKDALQEMPEVAKDAENGIPPVINKVQSEPVAPVVKAFVPDAVVDWPIDIRLNAPIKGEALLPLIQNLRQIGGKSVHFLGKTSEKTEAIVASSEYVKLTAYVQLANRHGPLTEIELADFTASLQQIGQEIKAEPVNPDAEAIILRAKQLYQFVVAKAVQLGISLGCNRQPWPVTTVQMVLNDMDFEQRSDGVFVKRDEATLKELFLLTINEPPTSQSASRLTLLLNLPCVSPDAQGFDKMITVAQTLCVRLDATIVDDNNQELTPTFIEKIRQQVAAYYTEMNKYAVSSGSETAIRLFG